MIDADVRAHPGDLPPIGLQDRPTPWDELEGKAAVEFARCGDYSPRLGSNELSAPVWAAQALVGERDAGKERERRSEMAGADDIYTLRAVAICRFWGGCGLTLPDRVIRSSAILAAWHARTERETPVPLTAANAEPFVLSLACGMGVRERQGLPSYPNEARLVAEERRFAADCVRRCAAGEHAACP